jgi:hypothetical protein
MKEALLFIPPNGLPQRSILLPGRASLILPAPTMVAASRSQAQQLVIVLCISDCHGIARRRAKYVQCGMEIGSSNSITSRGRYAELASAWSGWCLEVDQCPVFRDDSIDEAEIAYG